MMRGIFGGLWCNNALPKLRLILVFSLISAESTHSLSLDRFSTEIGGQYISDSESKGSETPERLPHFVLLNRTSGDVNSSYTITKRSTKVVGLSGNNEVIDSNSRDHVAYGVVGSRNTNGVLEAQTASVYGVRVEKSPKEVHYEDNGISIILANTGATLRLFGERFSATTIIRFVTAPAKKGSDCDDVPSTRSFPVS